MPEVLIYPAFRKLSYYTFYLEGLQEHFGEKSLKYSRDGFPKFYEHGLALRFLLPQGERRVYISAGDGPGLNRSALEWCDLYAKINVVPEIVSPLDAEKVLAIGPSFGLRTWNLYKAIRHALLTFWLSPAISYADLHDHLAHFRAQLRRLPQNAYQPGKSRSDYVFFASSLWEKEDATNCYRASFMNVVRQTSGVVFEGGFAPRDDVLGYDELHMPQRISLAQYIRKTKESVVVFNTPAVRNCLGWKLGEFLALGKAIISTPLSRQLPAPLEHGTHIHFVDGSEASIRDALKLLLEDVQYRRSLEKNARHYYDQYLKPRSVIQHILNVAYDLSLS